MDYSYIFLQTMAFITIMHNQSQNILLLLYKPPYKSPDFQLFMNDILFCMQFCMLLLSRMTVCQNDLPNLF